METGQGIEARTGRKLKGPDDCGVVSCDHRATHIYRRPDETDCSGFRVMRLCEMHTEGALEINSGIGKVSRIRRRA